MQIFRVTRSEKNLWTVGLGNPDGGPWEPLEDFSTRQEAKDWIINKVSGAQHTQTLGKMLDRYGEMIEQLEVEVGKLQNQVEVLQSKQKENIANVRKLQNQVSSLEYRELEAWPTDDPGEYEGAAADIITDLIQALPDDKQKQVSDYLQTLEPFTPIEVNPWGEEIPDLEQILGGSEIVQAAVDIEKVMYEIVEPGDIKLGLYAKIQEVPEPVYPGQNPLYLWAGILGINKVEYGLLTTEHTAAISAIEVALNKILDRIIEQGLDPDQQLPGMSIYPSVVIKPHDKEARGLNKYTVYYAGETYVIYADPRGQIQNL